MSLEELAEIVEEEDYHPVSEEKRMIQCPDAESTRICAVTTESWGAGESCSQCRTPVAKEKENGDIVASLEEPAEDCRHKAE